MAQPEPSRPAVLGDADEHVLTASGEFDVHDAPIDIRVYRFEDWIAFGFFWALSFVIFLQFFTRYALNDSASWTEEIARYLLICTVFIGATIGVRKNNHIQVDFLYRILPGPLMRVMSILVDIARTAFLGYATWLSLRIRRLRNAAERALDARGRIAAELPGVAANDESGDLARGFTTLLERLREHTEYLQTLASKLSHELRMPLAVVQSSLENLAAYVTRA